MLPVAILPAAGILLALGNAMQNPQLIDVAQFLSNDTIQLVASVMENAGNIVFSSTLNATTAGVEDLSLTAGTGNVTFTGAVGGSTALGDLTIVSSSPERLVRAGDYPAARDYFEQARAHYQVAGDWGGEGAVTLLLAVFTVGIGVGSLLCERLSARHVELGLVPLGSIGLTVFGLDLALASLAPEVTLASLEAVFAEVAIWPDVSNFE